MSDSNINIFSPQFLI